MKKKQLANKLMAGTLLLSASALSAETFTTSVEYEGTTYNLETSLASYSTDLTKFESNPWWGNQTLARGLATLVKFDLGNVDGQSMLGDPPPIPGAFFAWDVSDAVLSSYWTVDGVRDCSGIHCRDVSTSAYYVFSAASSGSGSTSSSTKSLRPASYTSAPDLIPSNVPTCSGSKFVSGVQVLGNGGIQWFVEHSKKDECFNVDVTVLPEGVSAKDMSAVLAVLGSNFDVYALR